jgi:tetratricopeptide (TPR) repeat protein
MNLKDSGKNLIKQKNWEKAEVVYDKILEIDPNNDIAKEKLELIKKKLKNKEQYNQAINLLAEKKYEIAIEKLEKLPSDSKYYDKYKAKKEVYFNTIISDIDLKLLKKNYKNIDSYFNAAKMMNFKADKIIDLHKRYDREKNKKKIKNRTNRTNRTVKRTKDRALARKLVSPNVMIDTHISAGKKLKLAKQAIKADYTYDEAYYWAGTQAQNLSRNKLAINYYNLFIKYSANKKKIRLVKGKLNKLK